MGSCLLCAGGMKPTSNTHSVQREILTGMLLSSCTSALGRPFLFPSAGSSHTGLCLLLFSGPAVVLTGSWGCPCLEVRPLGSPDEDSFPSLGPLGLSMPELSGSHPALGAGWPRVTHVREEGGGSGDRHLKWAFFHQCYVTWQSHLLCVKDRSDRGWGA